LVLYPRQELDGVPIGLLVQILPNFELIICVVINLDFVSFDCHLL